MNHQRTMNPFAMDAPAVDHEAMIDIFRRCYQAEYGEQLDDIRVIREFRRDASEVCLLEFVSHGIVRRMIGKRVLSDQSYCQTSFAEPESGTSFTFPRLGAQLVFPGSELGRPKPQLVDWEQRCVFLDCEDGRKLEPLMRPLRFFPPRASLQQLGQTFFQAGQWLHRFQELSGVHDAELSTFESVIRHCDSRLSLIQEMDDHRCPHDLRANVLGQIDQLLSRMPSLVPVAACHGDFGPWNLVARANELSVIDLYAFRREFVALDATHVLVNLEDQNVGVGFNNQRCPSLIDAFLRGYAPSPHLDSAALELGEILYRVCGLHSRLHSNSENFRERIRERRSVKRAVEWLQSPGHRSLVWSQLHRYAVHAN